MRETWNGRGPLAALTGLDVDLDRWLGELGSSIFPAPVPDGFAPTADVRETDAELLIEADLPGVPREAIDLSVDGKTLVLTGERRPGGEGRLLHAERPHGRFRRAFRLPRGADVARIDASFDRGVLTIRIPKSNESRTRRIEVRG